MSSSRRSAPDPEFLRVAFLHPDLGLGGAERLVVDAAAELAARGHTVDVFTSHFDPSRCFDECRSGAFRVIVSGSWLPRSLLGGRFVALCALARCCVAAAALAWHARRGAARGGHSSLGAYDAVVVDQVAGVVPVLRLFLWLSALLLPAPAPPLAVVARGGGGVGGSKGRSRNPASSRHHRRPHTPILFYCHFPDLLLSGGRQSALKRFYRLPLDALEQAATGAADACLVNSRFTAGVFSQTFPRLARRGLEPGVLYPAAAVPSAQDLLEAAGAWPGEVGLTPAQRAVVGEAAAEAAEAAAMAAGGGGGGGGGGLHSGLLQRSRALNARARGRLHLHHHHGKDGEEGFAGDESGGLVAAAAAAAAANGKREGDSGADAGTDDLAAFLRGGPVLLSVNRFERKKGLALGLEALRRLLDGLEEEREARQAARERRRRQGRAADKRQGEDEEDESGDDDNDASSSALPPAGDPRLVFAGGHDPRLPENVEHLRELMLQARRLGVWRHVRWVPSFSDRQRALLFAACRAVLYTPLNEHFGIVPLEAMAAARPVVCLASGGPLESVVDSETGFLCDPPDAERVAAAWRAALSGGGAPAAAMGLAARQHVERRFSRRAFGDALERALRDMVEG